MGFFCQPLYFSMPTNCWKHSLRMYTPGAHPDFRLLWSAVAPDLHLQAGRSSRLAQASVLVASVCTDRGDAGLLLHPLLLANSTSHFHPMVGGVGSSCCLPSSFSPCDAVCPNSVLIVFCERQMYFLPASRKVIMLLISQASSITGKLISYCLASMMQILHWDILKQNVSSCK